MIVSDSGAVTTTTYHITTNTTTTTATPTPVSGKISTEKYILGFLASCLFTPKCISFKINIFER